MTDEQDEIYQKAAPTALIFLVGYALNIDLSSQVEKFTQRFVRQGKDSDMEITPFVAGLGIDFPSTDDKDIKAGYRDDLEDKYNSYTIIPFGLSVKMRTDSERNDLSLPFNICITEKKLF